MPAAVRIVWPPAPTVTGARNFPDTAAVIVKLFAEAATTLAAIKVWKKLERPSWAACYRHEHE